MKSNPRGPMAMFSFVVVLFLILTATSMQSRRAWSFSVNVNPTMLASMTAGPGGQVNVQQPSPTTPTENTLPNAAGAPQDQQSQAPAVATTAPTTAPPPDAPIKDTNSKWPVIILGTVLVVGIAIIVLYLVNRERD